MTETPTDKPTAVEDLDSGFADEVTALPGGENIRKCFACGTCAAGCPVTAVDETYNCRRIIRQVLMGLREEVLASPVIWYCLTCYRCTSRCPQGVNFTDIMRVLRHLAVKGGHAAPELLSAGDEADRLATLLRRDLVKHTGEGREQVIEGLKSRLSG